MADDVADDDWVGLFFRGEVFVSLVELVLYRVRETVVPGVAYFLEDAGFRQVSLRPGELFRVVNCKGFAVGFGASLGFLQDAFAVDDVFVIASCGFVLWVAVALSSFDADALDDADQALSICWFSS